jgi:hypothetical protein
MEADLRRGGFLLMTPKEYEAQMKLKELNHAFEQEVFLSRVRLPLSGFVASLFSRIDTWRAARVERRAQVCFERGAL